MSRSRFLVIRRTSVRKPNSDEWISFSPGQVVTAPPKHAPVAEWVATGHWRPIKEGELVG